MQTIQLSILINAERQAVWNALQHQLNTRQRLIAFKNSDIIGGNNIVRKMPGGEEMLSQVIRYSPCEVLSIKHEVILENGEANYWHPEINNWTGLYEIYRLSEKDDQTVLHIEADSAAIHADWVYNQTIKTLNEIKLVSEQMSASLISN